MMLQTLIQLQILMFAAPALTGWTLLAVSPQPLLLRAVATQGAVVQAAAPRDAATQRTVRFRVVSLRAAICQVLSSPAIRQTVRVSVASVPVVAAMITDSHPFPNAPRAP